MNEWQEENLVILLQTTPKKSSKYKMVTCTGAFNIETKEWKRLWRVSPQLDVHRWDIIKIKIQRSSDKRQETYFIDPESIKKIGKIPKKERIKFIESIKDKSIEDIEKKGRSLGIIKPFIKKVELKKNTVKYTFSCNSHNCTHGMRCKDRGANILIRKYKTKFNGEIKILEKLRDYLLENIVYFGVGTHVQYKTWMLGSILWFKKPNVNLKNQIFLNKWM